MHLICIGCTSKALDCIDNRSMTALRHNRNIMEKKLIKSAIEAMFAPLYKQDLAPRAENCSPQIMWKLTLRLQDIYVECRYNLPVPIAAPQNQSASVAGCGWQRYFVRCSDE